MELSTFGIFGIYAAAFLLGAAHSLEPGHGKTVVAAYLVGSRGRPIDAVILGLVVTFTHSFSIILLGVVAKMSSRYFTDDQLHGYLGIVASLIILGIGIWMLVTRWPRRGGHGHHHHFHLFHRHGHHHGHDHHHHDHDHSHDHSHHHSHHPVIDDPAITADRKLGPLGLILLGISGGIVPCPAALAILLASASVGDIGKGLALVLVFSLGLAASLVAIGLVVVSGVKAAQKFVDTERLAPRIAFVSAVIVTLIGAVTLYSSISHFRML
ncbi:sulfite exporter TauE/SafE family protein [Geobacter sp. DSM 9736]|uniref:HoxN/HupN/NixA family nickel/cobalt transporter n=1 Tax=Geobacter sp. DSM 9736 TaxID=1277350 RepID=UPI000B5F5A5A|nr:sulfite exporter TauE/SafE family protein [Geobacter sp. DSM 9736]SNB47463.1 nickel/cobalt exporter [Geobacter sp. DSM 9736]